MWTTIAQDWRLAAEGVEQRVLKGAFPGAVICLHDGRELAKAPDIGSTLRATERVLPKLASQGYAFETLSSLLA